MVSVIFPPTMRESKDFEMWRNVKSGKTHIVTRGYMTAWCGADMHNGGRGWLMWVNRGAVGVTYMQKYLANAESRRYTCKRCISQWEV